MGHSCALPKPGHAPCGLRLSCCWTGGSCGPGVQLACGHGRERRAARRFGGVRSCALWGGCVRFLMGGRWLRARAPSRCLPRGVLSLPSRCPSEETRQALPLLFRRPWGSPGSAGAQTVCGVAGGVGAEPRVPSSLARPCVCHDGRLLARVSGIVPLCLVPGGELSSCAAASAAPDSPKKTSRRCPRGEVGRGAGGCHAGWGGWGVPT